MIHLFIHLFDPPIHLSTCICQIPTWLDSSLLTYTCLGILLFSGRIKIQIELKFVLCELFRGQERGGKPLEWFDSHKIIVEGPVFV